MERYIFILRRESYVYRARKHKLDTLICFD